MPAACQQKKRGQTHSHKFGSFFGQVMSNYGKTLASRPFPGFARFCCVPWHFYVFVSIFRTKCELQFILVLLTRVANNMLHGTLFQVWHQVWDRDRQKKGKRDNVLLDAHWRWQSVIPARARIYRPRVSWVSSLPCSQTETIVPGISRLPSLPVRLRYLPYRVRVL